MRIALLRVHWERGIDHPYGRDRMTEDFVNMGGAGLVYGVSMVLKNRHSRLPAACRGSRSLVGPILQGRSLWSAYSPCDRTNSDNAGRS